VSTLVVNRVLGDIDESCARCSAQRENQQAVLAEMRKTFEELDLVELPDLTGREDGRAALERIATAIVE